MVIRDTRYTRHSIPHLSTRSPQIRSSNPNSERSRPSLHKECVSPTSPHWSLLAPTGLCPWLWINSTAFALQAQCERDGRGNLSRGTMRMSSQRRISQHVHHLASTVYLLRQSLTCVTVDSWMKNGMHCGGRNFLEDGRAVEAALISREKDRSACRVRCSRGAAPGPLGS